MSSKGRRDLVKYRGTSRFKGSKTKISWHDINNESTSTRVPCSNRSAEVREWISNHIHFYMEVVTNAFPNFNGLTHWDRMRHICFSKLTIIGSDNSLSPGRHQAIIWTNAGILLIGSLGTNFSDILIEVYIFSFKNMHLTMSSENWRPFCLGLNVLIWT